MHDLFNHRYVNGKFAKEVHGNYILWEKHGRAGFTYSATHKNVSCNQIIRLIKLYNQLLLKKKIYIIF